MTLGFVAVAGGVCGGLLGWALHHEHGVTVQAEAWRRGWNERGDIEALRSQDSAAFE